MANTLRADVAPVTGACFGQRRLDPRQPQRLYNPVPGPDDSRTSPTGAPQRTSLSTLPTELQLWISRQLAYPDALSLKHVSRHFYGLVDSGVRLKVAWMVERHELRLGFPDHRHCILKTDEAFCSRQVRTLMERRRRHEECGEVRGCVVLLDPRWPCRELAKRRSRGNGRGRGLAKARDVLLSFVGASAQTRSRGGDLWLLISIVFLLAWVARVSEGTAVGLACDSFHLAILAGLYLTL